MIIFIYYDQRYFDGTAADGTFCGAVEDSFSLEPHLTLLHWSGRRYFVGATVNGTFGGAMDEVLLWSGWQYFFRAAANGTFGGALDEVFHCSHSQRHYCVGTVIDANSQMLWPAAF